MSVLGIDASSANKPQRTGVEWYAYHLLKAMKGRASGGFGRVVLYSPDPLVDGLKDMPDGWEAKHLSWPIPRGWMQGRVSAEMAVAPPDVLFVPGQALPRVIPKAVATTIHDIGFRRVPEAYGKNAVKALERATADAIERADRLFTVSQFTKDELIDVYGVPEDRVQVTPIALNTKLIRVPDERDTRSVLDAQKLFKPFFLYIGRLEEKKGVATAIDAFGSFIRQSRRDMDLVLVGSPGYGYEKIRSRMAALGTYARVRELGYLPERTVSVLLAACSAFVFPSSYEGFGMPNLEAMALGAPVLASDIPPHREVCADAARLVPPGETEAWAHAMHEVLKEDVREGLVARGLERVKSFSWERTADLTWKGLDGLL